jgi:hypothetical protein
MNAIPLAQDWSRWQIPTKTEYAFYSIIDESFLTGQVTLHDDNCFFLQRSCQSLLTPWNWALTKSHQLCSYSKKVPTLWSPKVHYNDHKGPLLVPVKKKKKFCGLSQRELYRPSDCHLSAKLVPTFADRGATSMTDPYGRILVSSRPEPLLFLLNCTCPFRIS